MENCSALRLNEELLGRLDEELARLDQRRKKSKIDLPMSSVCAGRSPLSFHVLNLVFKIHYYSMIKFCTNIIIFVYLREYNTYFYFL